MPPQTTTDRRRATRDDIARAALRIADAEGLAAVTMRRLGAELGVDPVIVYRHFAGKDEVLEAAADLVLAEVAPPPEDAEWRDQITAGCGALRAALLRHPAIAGLVMLRPPNGANQFDATERMMTSLCAAGLDSAAIAKAYQALVQFTLGAAYLQSALSQLTPEQQDDRGRALRLMYESLPASRYPNTTAVAQHLFRSPDESFEFGLRAMLDGLATQVATAQDATAPTARSPQGRARRRVS